MALPQLEVTLTDDENGVLNRSASSASHVPRLRTVIWGARTLRGADPLADEYKYIPVRRLALFSRRACTAAPSGWCSSPTTSRCGRRSGSTSAPSCITLFPPGAFQGRRPREAYFVKCDKETTTQNDINLGIVNIVVGFAPLKPAEFVIIKIQQIAGADRDLTVTNEEVSTMAQFSVNPQRFDPYKNFKFRVKWDGPYVAGREQGQRTQAHDRSGRAPRGWRSQQQPQVARPHQVRADHPGAWCHARHGVRAVGQQGLELRLRRHCGAKEVSLKDFRKEIDDRDVQRGRSDGDLLQGLSRVGLGIQAQADLDANANAIAIQHIKLENEGWSRDNEVAEPSEPTLTPA